MDTRSRVDLPSYVQPPYEVFLNGVLQTEGADFERVGPTLLFSRLLADEGKLSFWRWVRMFLGIAGTYRKHDAVTIAYSHGGRRLVANLTATKPD